MSAARRAGTNGPPTLADTRPRITACWTRRLPCTASSLTMISVGAAGRAGAWASAEGTNVAPSAIRVRAKKMERAYLPLGVMTRTGIDPRRVGLALRQHQPRLRDLDLAEDEVAPVHVHLDARPLRDL